MFSKYIAHSVLTLFISHTILSHMPAQNPIINSAPHVQISIPEKNGSGKVKAVPAFILQATRIGWIHRCRNFFLEGHPCITEMYLPEGVTQQDGTIKAVDATQRERVAEYLSGGVSTIHLSQVESVPGLYDFQESTERPRPMQPFYAKQSKALRNEESVNEYKRFLSENISPSYDASQPIIAVEQPVESSEWLKHYKKTGKEPMPTIRDKNKALEFLLSRMLTP